MYKVLIAGSRSFNDYPLLKKTCEGLLQGFPFEIVSGGAVGADQVGEIFAKQNDIPIKRFQPDYPKHGKSAPILRNEEMAKYADMAIIFWDGKSKGTKDMIDRMSSNGKLYYVINF